MPLIPQATGRPNPAEARHHFTKHRI